MKYFKLALAFLTAIPIRAEAPEPGDLGRSAMWFPLLGFGLGLLLAIAQLLLNLVFPQLLTAALVVALWAALTGGLHLDGLADCCDGLLATASPGRRLEIMRDPRLGSFGVIGLTLFLILKVFAIASLPEWGRLPTIFGPVPNTYFPIAPFLLAASISRWLIIVVARQPQARPDGMSADFVRGLADPVVLFAALVPLAWLTLMTISGGWKVVLAIVLAHLLAFAIIALARARLGGVTGDVFGLTVELAELTILLTFVAHAPF